MKKLFHTCEKQTVEELSCETFTTIHNNSAYRAATWLLLILIAFTFSLFPWGESQAETHFGIGYTDEQLVLDREWVLSQPPTNYTIQYVAALKPGTVARVIKNYPIEMPFRIINTHYDNKSWTVIIRGTYSSYSEALKVIKQLPERLKQIKPVIWARSFNSLHEIIVRPTVVAPKPKPVIYAFAATPNTIAAGESIALLADFTNGKGIIDNDLGTITANEPLHVTPSETITYTLTVTNDTGTTTSRSVTITVLEPESAINSFTATPSTITAGNSSSLSAHFANGMGHVDNDIGTVSSGESVTVTPSATTTYTLTVSNEGGKSVKRSLTITVVEPVPVETVTFDEIVPDMYKVQYRALRGVAAINWIMEKEAKHYTVHLYTTDSLRDMEQFVASKELPEGSAFYNVKEKGEMQHVLIYGDFSKRSQARKSIKKIDKSLRRGGLKLRRFKSLQKELDKAQY